MEIETFFDYKTTVPNPHNDRLINKYNSIIISGNGDVIKKIIEINPDFNLFLFNSDIFSDKFINIYELPFLVRNCVSLDKDFLNICQCYPKQSYYNSLTNYNNFISLKNNLLLKQIMDINKDIVLYKLHYQIFDDRYIKYYGIEYLAINYDKLNTSLLDVGFYDINKMNYLMKHPIPIKDYLYTSNDLTINKINLIESLSKDYNKRCFISYLNSVKDVDIITNDNNWNIIQQFIIRSNNKIIADSLPLVLSLMNCPNIFYFIDLLLDNNLNMTNLLMICEYNKILINNLNGAKLNKLQKNNFIDYCKKNNLLIFSINTLDELNNYNNIKNTCIEQYIESSKIFNNINNERKLNVILGYNNVLLRAQSCLKILMSKNIYQQYYNYLRCLIKLVNTDNKEDFKNNYKQLIGYNYSLDEIEKLTKPICVNDICHNLTIFDKSLKVVKLEGQPFKLLVHKISGLAYKNYANKINNDITNWDSSNKSNMIISTSLIDQYYIGIVPGYGHILGFNKINPNNIIDMGTSDIYSELIPNSEYLATDKSQFLLTDDLLRNSLSGYNEVVLKRYVDNIECRPTFVFSLDNKTNDDKNIAQYFNVPVYILNQKSYIRLMKNHLQTLLDSLNLDLYSNYLLQSFLSFYTNYNIAIDNFNDELLIEETNKIISSLEKYINIDNKELLKNKLYEIIDTYENISQMMYSEGLSQSMNYDKELMKKNIKRL